MRCELVLVILAGVPCVFRFLTCMRDAQTGFWCSRMACSPDSCHRIHVVQVSALCWCARIRRRPSDGRETHENVIFGACAAFAWDHIGPNALQQQYQPGRPRELVHGCTTRSMEPHASSVRELECVRVRKPACHTKRQSPRSTRGTAPKNAEEDGTVTFGCWNGCFSTRFALQKKLPREVNGNALLHVRLEVAVQAKMRHKSRRM